MRISKSKLSSRGRPRFSSAYFIFSIRLTGFRIFLRKGFPDEGESMRNFEKRRARPAGQGGPRRPRYPRVQGDKGLENGEVHGDRVGGGHEGRGEKARKRDVRETPRQYCDGRFQSRGRGIAVPPFYKGG